MRQEWVTIIKPIRILQITNSLGRGGLETILMNYYRHIDRSKIQFDFLLHYQARGAYEDEVEALGGKIYHIQRIRFKKLGRYLKEAEQFFNQHKEYNIAHSHVDALNTFPLMAAKKAGLPIRIAHSHCSGFFKKGPDMAFKWFSRMMLNRQCTDFFACSEQAGRFLFGEEITNAGKLIVMKNAIDAGKFKFSEQVRKKIRRELGIEDKFVIGHVGNFIHLVKNQDFLVDVFCEIQREEPESVLLLIGDGFRRKDTEERARRLGIRDKVFFVGSQNNVNEFMSAMDVYVLPSLSEGVPVTTIEAQATGLPVIASDCVPDDVAITDLLFRMRLAEGAEAWAKKILSSKNDIYKRSSESNKIVDDIYGIKENAKWLQDFYLSKANVI